MLHSGEPQGGQAKYADLNGNIAKRPGLAFPGNISNCDTPPFLPPSLEAALERLGASVSSCTGTISDNSPGLGAGALSAARPIIQPANGLRQAFPGLIPAKPYCADELSDGLQIRSKILALKKRHIQLNGPSAFTWMAHDIDVKGAYFAHEDGNLPPPNVIMCNPKNGRAHSAYLMTVPVARHSMARPDPLRYFAAIERGVARRLEADRYYSGLIAKNPLHPDWRTEWRRDQPYTLAELEGWLFERDMRPDPTIETTLGAGRNVTVFDELRTIAYREVLKFKRDGAGFEAWLARCQHDATRLNLQFPRALKLSEVRAIAKSVAKWTWRHFSPEKFGARQSIRGKISGAKRRIGSIEEAEPWKALGCSRRTYFNRKKAGVL